MNGGTAEAIQNAICAVNTAMLFEIAVCAALGFLAMLYNVYKFCNRKRTFFKDLGIPGPNSHPIYGNMPELFQMGALKATEWWASKYGDIVGYFSGFRPVIIVRDSQLLKEIFIRQFDNFNTRLRVLEITSAEAVNDVKISRLSGDKWRAMRALTSPAFRSSMMRRAFPIIDECTDDFFKILDKTRRERGAVEISQLFYRLSMDISLRYVIGARTNVQMASEETENFVKVTQASLRRSPYKWVMIFRNEDLVQLLFNAEENYGAKFKPNATRHSTDSGHSTNANIPYRRITPFSTVANAEVFVTGGNEPVTSALSFTTYLLAKHQDVQDKVRAEVKLLLEKHGNINYDNIFSLQYLNQVISESLRFYPPLPGFVTRRCHKNFEFNGVRIPKGTYIEVPVKMMHYDPRYWVNPEEFNPDRFRLENKSTIEPMAYLPFGIGPRSCPASRFSELELALIMAKTVVKYKLHLIDDAQKRTLEYASPVNLAFSDGGTWVRMEKI